VDTSLRLHPRSIRAQSQAAIRQLQNDNSFLDSSNTGIEGFNADNEITSAAFNGLKAKTQDLGSVALAFVSANSEDIIDHQTLIAGVGDEDLEGEIIDQNQRSAQRAFEFHEREVIELRRARANMLAQLTQGNLPLFNLVIIDQQIREHEGLRNLNEQLITHWREKEEDYHRIEAATARLFTGSQNVRRIARRGLELITLASAGSPGSYNSEMLNSWRTDIAQAKEASLDRLIAAVAITDDNGNVIDYRWNLLKHLSFDTLERIVTHSLGEADAAWVLQVLRTKKELLTRDGIQWAGHERDLLLGSLKDFTIMRRVIAAFDDDRFSPDVWRTLSIPEREALLQEFMNRIVRYFGVELNPEINVDRMLAAGSFNYETNIVNLNGMFVWHRDPNMAYGMFGTVVHEVRHAYQYAAFNNPENFIVSAPTAQAWQNNFESYDQFGEENPNFIIEKDAREFQQGLNDFIYDVHGIRISNEWN